MTESEWCVFGGVEAWVLFNFCVASGVLLNSNRNYQ